MKIKITILSILFSGLMLNAEIKVASVLGDNMVLQRNSEVKIWGASSPGEKISVKSDWDKSVSTITDNNGRWMVKIKTIEAGGPYNIKISSVKESLVIKNILLGEVWLCAGQSNMEMPIIGYNNQPINGMNDALYDADNANIRLFKVKRNAVSTIQENCEGNWSIANAESVGKFSAVGYFYAKLLQQRLKVPVGLICSSWGGTPIEAWMSKEAIQKYPIPYENATKSELKLHRKATLIYNGMIAPLINYTIKGAIWYQGEANIENYNYYADLMAGMIQSWRSDFGLGQFPFYFVQIAPFGYKGRKELPSAFLRDEQLKASLSIPNTGMACTIDIGEENCIHPGEKLTVSKRLVYWALSETYGIKGIPYKSPVFKNMDVKDNIATLTFDNAENGLTSFGKKVECFEVAGQDSIFYPATVTFSHYNTIVKAIQVKFPVAVRYGYCNFPKTEGYLYNTAGLPVPSFRTDNWSK